MESDASIILFGEAHELILLAALVNIANVRCRDAQVLNSKEAGGQAQTTWHHLLCCPNIPVTLSEAVL